MINALLAQAETASRLQIAGAMSFGIVIGWYVYYINRYRKADVQLSDVVTLVGAVGGGAILALFPAKTDLFGAYGLGLGIGFFSYFVVLLLFVAASKRFGIEFFLDGRRKKLADDEWIPDTVAPTIHPMEATSEPGKAPGVGN
jgi:hypothetical protein